MPDEAVNMDTLNEFTEDALAEETPPDIDGFLNEIGIRDKQYRCTLKQYPADGSGVPVFLPGGWKGSYPSIEEIGSKFGPGKYLYVFSWKVPTPSGVYATTCKQTEVVLGQQWQDAHEEYLYQYAIERKKKLQALKVREEQNSILRGQPDNGNRKDGVDELIEATNKLKLLGVTVGSNQQGSNALVGGENNMLTLILGMQQKSTDTMMAMMANSQNQMMQLFGLMLNNKGDGGASAYQEAMKQTINMVTGVVDLKQALNPEKEGMVDKIFNFMQGVAPEITRILAQPRQQAIHDPMVNLAKSRPEMQAVMRDQAAVDALAEKLYTEYGVKQSLDIMEVMGMKPSKQPVAQPTQPTYAPTADNVSDGELASDSEELEE
jgi:hypothetical protein